MLYDPFKKTEQKFCTARVPSGCILQGPHKQYWNYVEMYAPAGLTTVQNDWFKLCFNASST